jgi:hypothetical protein
LVNGGRSFIAPALAFCLTATFVGWMPDPNVAKWGIVYLIALCSAVGLWRRELILDRVDLALAAFVAWCGVTILWSPDQAASVDTMEKMGAVALIFFALRRVPVSRWTLPAGIVGCVAAWAFGDIYGGLGNPGFAAEFALIAAPMLEPIGFLVVIGGTLTLASFIPFVGLAAYPLALLKRPVLLAGYASLLLAALTFGATHSIEVLTGIETRLDLWAGTLAAWFRHPMIGWGVGSFVNVFPRFAGTGEAFNLMPYSVEAATYANAAHNEFIQLLMETGLVGLGLAAWLVYEALRNGLSLQARLSLAAAIAVACIGFPLQNPATAVLVAFVAAAPPKQGLKFRGLPIALVGALTAGLLVASLPSKVLAQAHLSAARRYQEVMETYPEAPLYALDHLNRAVVFDSANYQARIGLFVMAVSAEERGQLPREEVENAYRVAQTASPYDTRLLLGRLRTYVRWKACTGQCDFIASELVRTAGRKQEVQWLVAR